MHKETRKLQDKLEAMPLIPETPRLRTTRDRIMKKLMVMAQKHHDVAEIDLTAGFINNL